MKLGKQELDALTCPPGRKDMLVFDDELTGFAVRVTQGGTRTFMLQYRQGSTVKRLRLGEYGDITPTQARRLAEEARGRVAGGHDPAGERKARLASEADATARRKAEAASDALTFGVLVNQWQAQALRDRRDGYKREAVRCLRTCLARLVTQPAGKISPAQAQAEIDRIAQKHPTTSRRVRAYARAAYNWALRRELVPRNPFGSIDVTSREVSRDRVLSDEELGELWRALPTIGEPFCSFFRLLLLTLQRRSELAGMRWEELSADRRTWTVPASRAKNRKAHIVHLPDPAPAILASIARWHDPNTGKPSPLVFTSTGSTPISGFSMALNRLEATIWRARRIARGEEPNPKVKAGKPLPAPPLGWTLHDFRRTGVTALARLGVAPHVADRLLNHVQGAIRGVAAVYQRHDFLAERQAASEAWANHIRAVGEAAASPSVRRAGTKCDRSPAKRTAQANALTKPVPAHPGM